MSRGRIPPFPSGGSWQNWAQQLIEFLQDRDPVGDENAPRPVLLVHQTDNAEEVATPDGILMYDPALDVPVYSLNGEWVPIGSANTWYYTTTDDAGDGTVAGDANATDYTGQDGASLTGCAQVDEGEVAYFSHKGQLYVYTGTRPVSVGAGCTDTVTGSDFTPFVGLVNWDDIQGKPDTYPPDPHTHTLDEIPASIAGTNAYWRVSDTWVEADYNKLANIPAAFPPEAHTHTLSEIPVPIDDTKAYWRVNNAWLEADYTKLTNIPAPGPTTYLELTDTSDTTYLGKENYVPKVVYDLFGAGQHGLQLVPPSEGIDEPADNLNTYGREWDGAAGSWVPAVRKAGDTMTGFLTLNADPTDTQHAATKQYVDNTVGGNPTWYETRDDFVADVGSHTWVDGEVVTAADMRYLRDSDYDQIDDLIGWRPHGDSFVDHWGAMWNVFPVPSRYADEADMVQTHAAINTAVFQKIFDLPQSGSFYSRQRNYLLQAGRTYPLDGPIYCDSSNLGLAGAPGSRAIMDFGMHVADVATNDFAEPAITYQYDNTGTNHGSATQYKNRNALANVRIRGNQAVHLNRFGVVIRKQSHFNLHNVDVDKFNFGILLEGGQFNTLYNPIISGVNTSAMTAGDRFETCGFKFDVAETNEADGRYQSLYTTDIYSPRVGGGSNKDNDARLAHMFYFRGSDGVNFFGGYGANMGQSFVRYSPYDTGVVRQGIFNVKFFGTFFDGTGYSTNNGQLASDRFFYHDDYGTAGATKTCTLELTQCLMGLYEEEVFLFAGKNNMTRLVMQGCRLQTKKSIGEISGANNSTGDQALRLIMGDCEIQHTDIGGSTGTDQSGNGLYINGCESVNISNCKIRNFDHDTDDVYPITLTGSIGVATQLDYTTFNCKHTRASVPASFNPSNAVREWQQSVSTGNSTPVDTEFVVESSNLQKASLLLQRSAASGSKGTSYRLLSDTTGHFDLTVGTGGAVDQHVAYRVNPGSTPSQTWYDPTSGTEWMRLSENNLKLTGTDENVRLSLTASKYNRDNYIDVRVSSKMQIAVAEEGLASAPSIELRVKQHNHIEMDGLSTTITGNGAPALVIDGNTAFQSAITFNKAGDGTDHWRVYPTNSSDALTFQSNSTYSYTMIKSGTPSGNNIMRASDVAAAYTSKASLLSLLVSKGLITQAEADTI